MRKLSQAKASVAFALLLTLALPVRAQSGAVLAPQPVSRSTASYRLEASDTVEIRFPLTPEYDQIVTIPPDGVTSLGPGQEVRLAGLTALEAAEAVRRSYAGTLRNPIVTVNLKDFNRPYFVVTGSVGRPGKYDLRGETYAMEAIAIAGGFTDASKHSHVLLFRRVSDAWYQVTPLNLKHVMQGHALDEDALLRSGDMLVVPQNTFSKIKRLVPSSGIGAYFQPQP